MPAIRFQIEKYQVTLGADLPSIITDVDVKVAGIVGCYGKGYQLMINFIEDNQPMPQAMYDEKRKTGAIFIPVSRIDTYVDLLRNEKPVFAYCNSEKPEWSNISTEHEETGEGER